MANDLNANPIIVDTAMADFWRTLQTLNTGNLPATAQSGSLVTKRQFGINVTKIIWADPVISGNQVIIIAPDNRVLFSATIEADLDNQDYDFNGLMGQWKDFKVTQIDGGTLYIYYRA